MAFAPGDVVTLRSGGHSMTVVSVSDDDIECLWLGDDGELYRQSIPAVALRLLESFAINDEDDVEDDERDEDDKDEDNEDDDEDDDEDDQDEDDEEEDERAERRRAR